MLILITLVVATTVSTAIAVSATAASTTATVSAAAAVAAATTSTITTASTTTAGAGTVFAGTGFVYYQLLAHKLVAIQLVNRLFGLIVVGHFYKTKTTALPRKLVVDNPGRGYFSELFKQFSQFVVSCFVIDVCYVNVHFLLFLKNV